jgi:hypothetical protein
VARGRDGNGSGSPVRLSVVLDEALSEHVRRRAFETRKSRSAYVRQLVENDLRETKKVARVEAGH